MSVESGRIREELDRIAGEKQEAIRQQDYRLAASYRDVELRLQDVLACVEAGKSIPAGRSDSEVNRLRRAKLWSELMAEYCIDEYFVDYDNQLRPLIRYPVAWDEGNCHLTFDDGASLDAE